MNGSKAFWAIIMPDCLFLETLLEFSFSIFGDSTKTSYKITIEPQPCVLLSAFCSCRP